MPEAKRARPEGTKCPCAAILLEAIFNYVVTVEEYDFALSEAKMLENCGGEWFCSFTCSFTTKHE